MAGSAVRAVAILRPAPYGPGYADRKFARERGLVVSTQDLLAPGQRPPAHGFTRSGLAVHRRTRDHLPTSTSYQRFNKKTALLITDHVGTMACTWIFLLISLSSLLAVLYAAHIIGTVGFLTGNGFILCVTWISQNFLQLVLLPALMVGQNLQNEAADARAAKTFEDVEDARQSLIHVIDLLDCHTVGGLHDILQAVESLKKGPALTTGD
jgi:hypothetical protein